MRETSRAAVLTRGCLLVGRNSVATNASPRWAVAMRWNAVAIDCFIRWVVAVGWNAVATLDRSLGRSSNKFRLRRALVLHLILGLVVLVPIVLVGRGFVAQSLVGLGIGWLTAGCLMAAVGLRAPNPWPAVAQFLPAVWLLLACGAVLIQLLAPLASPTTPTLSTKTYTIPDPPDQVFGPWILSDEARHLWNYEDGKLKGPVQLGVGPYAMLDSGFAAGVWVANGGSNTVSRIDQNTKQLMATIPVGHRPAALDVDTNGGDILVANRDDGSIVRIDPKTNRVTATIPIGHGLVSIVSTGPCITCDDKSKLWVADEIDETVVCVDLRTNRVLTVLPVGGRPTKLALSEFPNPDRSTLEVLIPEHQSMVAIDLKTRRVVWTVHMAPGAIEVLPRGYHGVAVLTETTAAVTEFDVVTGREGKTVGVGAQPVAMAETERTLTLWVANKGDNTVTVIDSELPKTATIRVGKAPVAISHLGIYGGGINAIVANHDDHNDTPYQVCYVTATRACLTTVHGVRLAKAVPSRLRNLDQLFEARWCNRLRG
jgi:YVTN family beta-propeller protein